MEMVYNLTPLQEGIWNRIKLFGENSEYEIPCFIELSKDYTECDIERSLETLVEYNSAFRVKIFGFDTPKQYISESRKIDIDVEYIKDSSEEETLLNFLNSYSVSIVNNLSVFKLYCFPERKILACKFHHIISDGYSVSLFERELKTLLNGQTLCKRGTEYEDLLNFNNDLGSELSQRFWKKYLEKPIDFLEPRCITLSRNRKKVKINLDLTSTNLKRCAKKFGVTEFCLVLSLVKVFTSCFFDKKNLLVATPINTRKTLDDDNTINFMANVLPVMMQINQNMTLHEICTEVQEILAKLIEYCDYPTSNVSYELKHNNTIENDINLFSIVFDMKKVSNSYLERVIMDYSNETEYPLLLSFIQTDDDNYLELNYDCNYLDDLVVSEFQESFRNYINVFFENRDKVVSELSISSKGFQRKLLGTSSDSLDCSIYDLNTTFIDKQKVEIIYGDKKLDAENLMRLSDSFGTFLRRNRITKGAKIAVCNKNRLFNAMLFYCIQDNQCCYIPIDSDYPKQRIIEILNEADPLFLFTDIDNIESDGLFFIENIKSFEEFLQSSLNNSIISENKYLPGISYIIFTSGSTGKPKGVPISYSNLYSLVSLYEKYFDINKEDKVAQVSSFSFDASIFEMTLAYSRGSKLLIFDKNEGLDKFPKFIQKNHITHFLLTPDLYTLLDFSECDSLKCVVVGGANYKKNTTLPPGTRLINAYGPSESTIMTTMKVIDKTTEFDNVGQVLDNSKVVLINSFGQIVPRGVNGEICILGQAVFQGYLNIDNSLTFRTVNFDNQQFIYYPTGDIGYFDSNNDLHFVSRSNNLVKIRGNRVDINEITNLFIDKLKVKNAITIYYKDNLYVFYSGLQSVENLLSSIKDMLPSYMLPRKIINLKNIPTNTNGKPDTTVLKKIIDDQRILTRDSSFKESQDCLSSMENDFITVIRNILDNQNIHIDSNFFAEGGDSIKSIQIANELGKKGYNISSVDILKSNNIRDMCRSELISDRKYDQSEVVGKLSLTPIQKWFFQHNFFNINFWNQSEIFDIEGEYSEKQFKEYFGEIRLKHDNLRVKFKKEDKKWTAKIRENNLIETNEEFSFINLSEIDSKQLQAYSNQIKKKLNESLDIEKGILNKLCVIQYGKRSFRLIWVMHHLICDNISWSILKSDLFLLLNKDDSKKQLKKKTNIKQWSDYLEQYNVSQEIREIWRDYIGNKKKLNNDFKTHSENSVMRTKIVNNCLISDNIIKYLDKNTISLELFWLVVFGRSIATTLGLKEVWISKENNGRTNHPSFIQLDRLVGWCTSVYPICIKNQHTLKETLSYNRFKIEQMSSIGFDYQMLDSVIQVPNISFNYLGDATTEEYLDSIVETSDINEFDFFDELAINVIKVENKYNLLIMYNEQNSKIMESIINNVKENISNDFEQDQSLLSFGLSQETLVSLEDLF